MAGTANADMTGIDVDLDSSSFIIPSSQELQDTSRNNSGDIFLTIQSATTTVSKIYTEYFALSKVDFSSSLLDRCDIEDLRYVRDMLVSIVKRKLKQTVGPLIERKSGNNLKENLVKDIYSLYSLGEGAIPCLPKQMIKCDSRFVSEGVQTDNCLSNTVFASISDLETVKSELTNKLSEVRNEILSIMNSNNTTIPLFPDTAPSFDCNSSVPDVSSKSSQHQVATVKNSAVIVEENSNLSQSCNINSSVLGEDVNQPNVTESVSDRHEPKRKIIIAGDSLLHRVNCRKMKVANIPTVKLTKKGDSLAGTVSRSRNFISKHVKEQLDIVILAGTNDLTRRDVSPESLIEELDSSITELKQFSNLDNVFICKIPARLDRSLINRKVALYNELLVERFSDTEEYISVIDTAEPEVKYYHDDGLHLGHNGIRKLCSIILSKLYKVLSPANHRARDRLYQIPRCQKRNSPNRSTNRAKDFGKKKRSK